MGFGASDLDHLESMLWEFGNNAFAVAPLSEAEVLFFNGDLPGCATIIRRLRQHRKCPIIVVGSTPHENIPDVQFLQYPLTPDTLMETLYRIVPLPGLSTGAEDYRAEKNGAEPAAASGASPEINIPVLEDAQEDEGAVQTNPRNAAGALERNLGVFDHYAGFVHDVNLDDPLQTHRVYFNPNGYLSEYLRRSLIVMGKEAALIDVAIQDQRILLDLTGNRWGGDMNEELLQRSCLGPLRNKPKIRLIGRSGVRGKVSAQGKEETVPGLADFSGKEQLLLNHRMRRAEFIIAQIALWCARGRLREGTDIHTPLSLRHWPNLPCLPRLQGAMQMAALWMLHPCSLAQTIEITGLKQRQVFAFYTVCDSLCLFVDQPSVAAPTADDEWVERIRSALHSTHNKPDPQSSRGILPAFLRRLLSKVWK